MKSVIWSLVACMFLGIGCGNDRKMEERAQRIAEIDSLSKIMFDKQNTKLDIDIAKKEIAAYREFVNKLPDDTLSPKYLYLLSDLARGIQDYNNSIQCLSEICEKYPKFKKVPECIFLHGFYLQEYIHDTLSAKVFYTKLIEQYPNHPFAKDAKVLISQFGKSDEELVKEFQQKSKTP